MRDITWRKVTSKKEKRIGEYFFMNQDREFVVKVYKGYDHIAQAIEELSEIIQTRADEIAEEEEMVQ